MQKDPVTDHMDLQERLDHTKKLFVAALDRFHVCRENLPSINEDMDQQVSAYADGLIDWVVGNIQWSSVNHRYNTFLNDRDRKSNIMKLDLDSPRRKLQRFFILFVIALTVSIFMVYLFL